MNHVHVAGSKGRIPVSAGYNPVIVWSCISQPLLLRLPHITNMRLILPAVCILVLAILASGCIQSPPSPPVTPSETSAVIVLTPDTVTTVTTHPRMEVNVSAEQTHDSVIIRVDGGRDAGSLVSLNVRIINRDGTNVQRTIPTPVAGNPYTIQYYRIANAANANVVGTFSDGYQQTLLMTSL